MRGKFCQRGSKFDNVPLEDPNTTINRPLSARERNASDGHILYAGLIALCFLRCLARPPTPLDPRMQIRTDYRFKGVQPQFIYFSQLVLMTSLLHGYLNKESKGAKIRNRYNQVPQLTQNTNGKVTNSQLDTTN